MKVTLTVIEGPHRGSAFEFLEHDAFLVGRSPEVQFRLPLRDKALSRVHFLVEVNPPSCRLMDMASTNGVRVNGKRVHAVDLQDGDRIEAGATVLAFAVEDDDDDRTEIRADAEPRDGDARRRRDQRLARGPRASPAIGSSGSWARAGWASSTWPAARPTASSSP